MTKGTHVYNSQNKPAAEVWAEILDEMRRLGVTPEMVALPTPRAMVDVTPAGNGVANRPNGKSGMKH